jgi:hypothetical protein
MTSEGAEVERELDSRDCHYTSTGTEAGCPLHDPRMQLPALNWAGHDVRPLIAVLAASEVTR